MAVFTTPTLEKDIIPIHDFLFEIPESFRQDMRVPARLYMSKEMFEDIKQDRSLIQLVNTATLPGIVRYALAMPDIHQGYGFPIGGVVATNIGPEGEGVISPGGIGYDINCGVRLLVSTIAYTDLKKYMQKLADALYHAIPSGVGQGGKIVLKNDQLNTILSNGAHALVEQGYGVQNDLTFCEETGRMAGANADLVSDRAKQRGLDQLGTLGSGNHFLEVQRIEEIFDEDAAKAFGLAVDGVTIMIHCGSRGLGHQVCTDYVRRMVDAAPKFGYTLPDRELVCAPFHSQEGQDYFSAMAAAANFAWSNRHMIGHLVRQAWKKVLGDDADLNMVYDVSHNIGKREWHTINNKKMELLLHRKGATRSFGPGRPELPLAYKDVGQPVLIPGTMGTSSYILVGTQESMDEAFGSCCHGAGRRMSRSQAKKMVHGATLRDQLEKKGIILKCDSNIGLAEEAPLAYKDIDNVIQVVHGAKIAKKVARVRPLAVIKGE